MKRSNGTITKLFGIILCVVFAFAGLTACGGGTDTVYVPPSDGGGGSDGGGDGSGGGGNPPPPVTPPPANDGMIMVGRIVVTSTVNRGDSNITLIGSSCWNSYDNGFPHVSSSNPWVYVDDFNKEVPDGCLGFFGVKDSDQEGDNEYYNGADEWAGNTFTVDGDRIVTYIVPDANDKAYVFGTHRAYHLVAEYRDGHWRPVAEVNDGKSAFRTRCGAFNKNLCGGVSQD